MSNTGSDDKNKRKETEKDQEEVPCESSARTRPLEQRSARADHSSGSTAAPEANGASVANAASGSNSSTTEELQRQRRLLEAQLRAANERKEQILAELEKIRARSRQCRATIQRLHNNYRDTLKRNQNVLYMVGRKCQLGKELFREVVVELTEDDEEEANEKEDENSKKSKKNEEE